MGTRFVSPSIFRGGGIQVGVAIILIIFALLGWGIPYVFPCGLHILAGWVRVGRGIDWARGLGKFFCSLGLP